MSKKLPLPIAVAVILAFHPLPSATGAVPAEFSPSPVPSSHEALPGGAAHPTMGAIAARIGPHAVDILFSEDASFIFDGNGDLYLEFDPICEMVWNAGTKRDECTFPSRHVHFDKGADRTEGTGILFGMGEDGSVWTIDLGQISSPGRGLLDGRDLGELIAEEIGGAQRKGVASFTW